VWKQVAKEVRLRKLKNRIQKDLSNVRRRRKAALDARDEESTPGLFIPKIRLMDILPFCEIGPSFTPTAKNSTTLQNAFVAGLLWKPESQSMRAEEREEVEEQEEPLDLLFANTRDLPVVRLF